MTKNSTIGTVTENYSKMTPVNNPEMVAILNTALYIITLIEQRSRF
jgi:hypothetical protein